MKCCSINSTWTTAIILHMDDLSALLPHCSRSSLMMDHVSITYWSSTLKNTNLKKIKIVHTHRQIYHIKIEFIYTFLNSSNFL